MWMGLVGDSCRHEMGGVWWSKASGGWAERGRHKNIKEQNAELIRQSELSMERCALVEKKHDSVESRFQDERHQLTECRAELAQDRELCAELATRQAESPHQSKFSTES